MKLLPGGQDVELPAGAARPAPSGTGSDAASPALAGAFANGDGQLDALDFRLLNEWQRDCTLSHRELAERLHASAPTIFRRIKRLLESGLVERRAALLAPDVVAAQVGWGLTAILEVTLERQSAEALDAFERSACNQAEVQQCYRIGSGPDFVLVVQVRDMPAYHAFAHRALGAAQQVRNVRSYFSVRRAKFDPTIRF